MIVGRERESSILVERLGAGRPVAVLGEAGVGKTTLVRLAAERGGQRLVEAGALATLSWLAYFPLGRAFGRELDGDAEYLAEGIELELGNALLFLDDLQWADTKTVALLPHLVGRVALVAAVRRGDPGTASALAAAADAAVELLPLEPLPEEDATELARALHPELSETATARLVERSGGNPFLVEQLAATGEATDSLRLTVAARLRVLSPAGREAIATLALLGRPANAQLVGEAGAAEIVEAGFATANGEVTIRHALLAEAAVELLSEAERVRVHSRIAAAVEDLGEAARHHAAAGERGQALERALLAAERAATPGDRAAHLAVAAANVEGARGDSLRLQAARLLVAAGEPADALALVASLRPSDRNGAAEAALLRSQAHLGLVQPDDAERELTEAVAASADDVLLRLRIIAQRSRLASRDGLFEETLALAEEGVELAAHEGIEGEDVIGLYSSLGYAREFLSLPGAIEAHEQALAVARRGGHAERELSVLSSLGFALLLEGETERADALAQDAIELARSHRLLAHERRSRVWRAGFAWHLARPATAAGEIEGLFGEALSPEIRELAEPYWWMSMADLGRGEHVRAHVESRLGSAPADESGSGDALWALAEIELAAGRPDQAERAAARYAERYDRAWPFVEVVRAWAQYERGTEPAVWDRPTVRLAEAARVEVDALARGASGDAEGAAAGFGGAAALWHGRHERGALRCRAAAAEALRLAGRIEEARTQLLDLEAELESRKLEVLLRRVRRSLRLAGLRRPAPRTTAGPLTGREREVLELVAHGLTNDEIARRLGLGRPTVVRLIRNAQQKLGAANRVEAATLAAER